MKIISIIVLTFFIVTAYANQLPISLATDGRIKVAYYNTNEVFTIHGNHMISTGIYFDKTEIVENIDMGDTVAWGFTIPKEAQNTVFLKPNLLKSDTNMTIITNKRIYRFRLFTNSDDTPQSKNVMFALQFKYPEEDQAEFESNINQMQHAFSGNSANNTVSWNYNYSFYGSKHIAPIQAVDNGTFTVLKFPKNAIIPAIFAVDNHSNESMVNIRTDGDYIFIQGVRRQYTLRNGENVTTLYNDSFNIN